MIYSHLTSQLIIERGMQLSLEARQRIHERYERQSVSQRQLAEDFQVSLSTVKGFFNAPRTISAVVLAAATLGKFMSANASASPNMPNNTPMLFCANMPTKSRGNAGYASRSKPSACISENSNGRSKKQTHLSGIPLGALAATVAALYRGVDPIAAETQGRVPLGRRNGGLR